MAPKPSKPTLRQTKLVFSASKPNVSLSTFKKGAASLTKKASSAGNPKLENSDKDEIEVEDIELLTKSETDSDSEIEDADEGAEEDREEAKQDVAVAPAGSKVKTPSKGKDVVKTTAGSTTQDIEGTKKEPEVVQKAHLIDFNSRPQLDVKNRAYDGISAEARRKMGYAKPIHDEDANRVQNVLRVFDLSYEYGPAIGIARLARWERAHALGLNPPPEIYDILMTKEGLTKPEYSEDILTRRV